MKVYGFDSTDVVRGELQVEEVDAIDMHFPEEMQAKFGWDLLSTRFSEARSALVRRMKAEGSDPESISLVESLKASYLQV
ncbi:hypothetical protein [Marinobacter sp. P4B1]|uniref:hypothetical protein n=1 Tax=Marinobacter sp. P4B1 TaxID=1119533 RepID=UPI00071DD9E8|nr:hypothetical protein [Marinobacter sp. P4B1]KRW83686.1 hypothetical protein AQ621_16690 [Marinobacter sp. P4B1]